MITITANRTGNPGTITEVLLQAIGFGPNLTDLAACRQYVAPPYGPPFLHAQAGTVKRLALVQRKPGTQAEINQIALARIVFFVYVAAQPLPGSHQCRYLVSWCTTDPGLVVSADQPPLRFIFDAAVSRRLRSEAHTSELQSLMRISYADFCLTYNNRHASINI